MDWLYAVAIPMGLLLFGIGYAYLIELGARWLYKRACEQVAVMEGNRDD